MASTVSALAVFCDDVREEVGNKISLMGVYGADIKFRAKPPVTYPRLGVVVWTTADVKDFPKKLTIRVLAQPGNVVVFSADIDTPVDDEQRSGDNIARLQTAIGVTPLNIKAAGFIEVEVDTGTEKIKAGQLSIEFHPPPEAAEVTSSTEPERPA
jgi:hypothetical protein